MWYTYTRWDRHILLSWFVNNNLVFQLMEIGDIGNLGVAAQSHVALELELEPGLVVTQLPTMEEETVPEEILRHQPVIFNHVQVKVASGRTHYIFTTCSGAPATVPSCQLAALPQHSHNCSEYSQLVLATGALRSTGNKLCCHTMLPELNLSQLPQHAAGVVRVLRISTTRRSGLCCGRLATGLQFVVGNLLPICCECRPKAT